MLVENFRICLSLVCAVSMFSLFLYQSYLEDVKLTSTPLHIWSRDIVLQRHGSDDHNHKVLSEIEALSELYMEKHADCANEISKPRLTSTTKTNWTRFEYWRKHKKYRHSVRDAGFYINATGNCTNFRQSRGYIMSSLSPEEAAFSIAYSILAYTDLEMLERLLRSIYRPEHVFCVHVDIKSKRDYFRAVESIVNCFPNVFLAPKRVDVKWGNFSVIEPDLICMKALWNRDKKWKYFINLTGQEFPLKTNSELVKILTAYRGANDVGVALP